MKVGVLFVEIENQLPDWIVVNAALLFNRNREFEISFLPLTVDASKEGPQGFNGGRFGHPIGDPAPKGLGLKALFVREGVVAAKAAPKKK